MSRLIEINDGANFKPLIHDVLKTLSILLVVEMMMFYFNKDPLLDKIFVRMTIYNLIGVSVYHLFIDKIIGTGPTCCNLTDLLHVKR